MILYGSESWVLTKKQESHIQPNEMKFLEVFKCCTRQGRFRNIDIREVLQIYNLIDKIKENHMDGKNI